MNTLASLLLSSALQASAVTALAPPSPGVCTLRYEDLALGLVAVIETRSINAASPPVTAFAVSGNGLRKARLITPHFDSAKLLKPVAALPGEALRLQANLDGTDAPALLIQELSTIGGRMEIQRDGKKGIERLELPHPLPRREVVSKFLFCVQDLTSLKAQQAEPE